MRWVGYVESTEEIINVYRIVVGNPKGNRPLGRPKRRWKNNTKINFKEIEYEGVDWIHLAQDKDQVAGSCEYSNEPSGEECLD
jgi:hypothetical protein